MAEKVILVTGASSGSGRAIASLLSSEGYRVFGTSRNPKSDTLDGFEMVQLDVTNDESVTTCVQTVIEKAGKIDVLVNNAGVELIGAAEEVTIEESKALFETNLFGVMRMVKAVLPHMRQRGSGIIINISSVAGFSAPPYQSSYAASKHALEAYSEALRFEVQPFGIEVKLVEPGIFNSGITRHEQLTNPIAVYDKPRNTFAKTFEGYIERGMPASVVAQMVRKIVQGRTRRMRHIVSTLDTRIGIFSKASPEWMTRVFMQFWAGLRPLPFRKNNADSSATM